MIFSRGKSLVHTGRALLAFFILNICFACCVVLAAPEGALYENPDTGFGVFIEDFSDLLTDEEEKELAEAMRSTTVYGNAILYTHDATPDAGSFCEDYYVGIYGANVSGVVFYIDPEYIYLYSEGEMYDVLGTRWADTIMDNVYTYANGDTYLKCCKDVFSQVNDVMEGKRVPQPMKYIGNALLGLLIAFFACFIILERRSTLREAPVVPGGTDSSFILSGTAAQLVSETKTYSPRSSGSSGSRHRSGGHRSGGGGHRGGGGGHRH